MKESDFLKLINEHSGVIHKILFLYVDDPEDKRDLKQEILLQAWKSIHRFKGNSAFSTWLYRVALNTVLTYRKKDRSKMKTSIEEVELEQEVTSTHDKADQLYRAIKNLNDIDKTIISLHLDDFSNEEIAGITGLSKNNVAVKLHRIKEGLTQRLKEINYG